MKSINNIILLELLYKHSNKNKDKILDMFMETVDATDIYKRLEDMINSNIFIGDKAAELIKKSNEMLNRVRVSPTEAINIFFVLEELILNIEKSRKESLHALKSADFFEELPSVVDKGDSAFYSSFYESFYKAYTYITATMYGIEGIMNWSAYPIGNFSDLISFIENVLAPKLSDIKPTIGKWSVREKYYSGGLCGISYTGYELVYEKDTDFCKIGSDKYPYIKINSINDQKIVEGYGFISGVSVESVTSLFEGELVNEVNVSNACVDAAYVDSTTICDPVSFMSRILGTNKFILSPNAYVKLLNKYMFDKTVLERRSTSKCPLCGRTSESRVTGLCSHHFDYTQN